MAGSAVQHAFLISERTPVSLLKRDLLCKLHASIHCTPDGLFLAAPESKVLQAAQYLQFTNGFQFCWTFPGFNRAETFAMVNLQSIIKPSLPCAS